MNKVAGQSNLAAADRRRLILAVSGPLVVIVLWLARRFFQPLGHDQINFLIEAHRFLAGDQIYGEHIAEVNPPLMVWFSTIPVYLGSHLHLSVILIFRALTDLMVCASAVWCVTILQRSRRWASPASMALAGLGLTAVEISLNAFDFGQREHLLVMLLLPYLLAVASQATSRLSFAERCAMGVSAGFAVWCKPQDILLFIALELFYAILHRTLRRFVSAEFLAFLATACVLLAMVLVLAPLYLAKEVPILVDVYWAFASHSFFALLLDAKLYIALLLAGLLLCLIRRASSYDWSTPATLFICSAAGLVAFCIQHTDWEYHKYPHEALMALAFLCLLIDWLDPKLAAIPRNSVLPRLAAFAGGAIASILLCLVLIHPAITLLGYKPDKPSQFDHFLDGIKPGTPVAVLALDLIPQASVYVHHLEWGSRFAHLWMMPAIIQNERGRNSPTTLFKQLSPERVASLAAMQRRQTTEDLKYWQPAFVFVAKCTKTNPCMGLDNKDVDLLAWFQQSPEFEQVWSRYDRQPSIDGFDVYKLAR